MAVANDTMRPPAPLPYVRRTAAPVDAPRTADGLLADIAGEIDRREVKARQRRLLTCYHEAGHAVAVWWMGYHSDRAVVLTPAEVGAGVTIAGRRGRTHHGEGAVIGYDIAEKSSYKTARRVAEAGDDELWRCCDTRARMAMVMSYAGPIAEARFRQMRIEWCFYEGGMVDLDEADRVAAEWFADGPAAIAASEQCERVARALVRSRKGWAAISAVAVALQERGEVDGSRIAALCAASYGAAPKLDAWALRWPPTAEEIRSGYLP